MGIATAHELKDSAYHAPVLAVQCNYCSVTQIQDDNPGYSAWSFVVSSACPVHNCCRGEDAYVVAYTYSNGDEKWRWADKDNPIVKLATAKMSGNLNKTNDYIKQMLAQIVMSGQAPTNFGKWLQGQSPIIMPGQQSPVSPVKPSMGSWPNVWKSPAQVTPPPNTYKSVLDYWPYKQNAPMAPNGQIAWDDAVQKWLYWDGSKWIDTGTGGLLGKPPVPGAPPRSTQFPPVKYPARFQSVDTSIVGETEEDTPEDIEPRFFGQTWAESDDIKINADEDPDMVGHFWFECVTPAQGDDPPLTFWFHANMTYKAAAFVMLALQMTQQRVSRAIEVWDSELDEYTWVAV